MNLNQKEMFPPLLIKGIDEFNKQQYFQCHETLETLWRSLDGPAHIKERLLTQAIIQFAVGYYHWQRSNFQGAEKLFNKGLAKIDQTAPNPARIDIQSLVDQIVSDMPKVVEHCRLEEFPVIRFL